jgi:hypothetical protein
MIYQASITTLKNTASTSPKETILKVTKGLVYKIEVFYPLGSSGLLGCSVWDGSFQVWPTTLGTWFIGDGNIIAFDEVYLKEEEPFEFRIYTYNEDDTYNHYLSVRLGLVSKEIFMARFLPHLSYKYMMDVINQLAQQQAEQQQQQAEELLAAPFSWLTE